MSCTYSCKNYVTYPVFTVVTIISYPVLIVVAIISYPVFFPAFTKQQTSRPLHIECNGRLPKKCILKIEFFFERSENIVGKGENGCN